MTDAASVPARRHLPRWVWVVLIASLAANLFVIGVVARTFWPSRYASASHGGILGNLMAYTRTLPEDRRAVVRQGLGKERPLQSMRPLREELRSSRREAARLFKADPFDREAFLAAEARVQATEARIREAAVRAAVDIVGRMTADERAGFLKWRELRRPGHKPGQAERDGEAESPSKKAPE